jgi:hypothetical protein
LIEPPPPQDDQPAGQATTHWWDEPDPAPAVEDLEPDQGSADDDLTLEVDPADEAGADALPSRRFESWRRRTAVGALGTGFALALQDVFYPTDRDQVITAPAPGDPPDADERIRVHLDLDDPTKSVAVIPATKPPAPPA